MDRPPVLLVSHFHWDREWYREFEAFRARLVDAVDRLLELLDDDPGYRFVLDGQAVALDDYLEIRPDRRADLDAAVRAGRVALGPWYVQPDSLLPSGESHVRNLLLGRATADAFGATSRVAYMPDSFGHPAQFPQLFAGFGLDPFVYWRGNGDEIDHLGPLYRWVAPDGSAVTALWLAEGYFSAARLDADPETAAECLAAVLERLPAQAEPAFPVVLMNGFDHDLPDAAAGPAAEALARRYGAEVRRGLLDNLNDHPLDPAALAEHRGELTGARHANLLPGVWSARLPLKLRNRRAETLLRAWAEPWAALARPLRLPDERPALHRAWRALLCNQAHDSIGGCSIDAVHEQMEARFDTAEGLARETVTRVLERLAGRGTERRGPDLTPDEDPTVAVFNPSPHPRVDLVRVPLDGYPPWSMSIGRFDIHPLALAAFDPPGYTAEGRPVRVVPSDDPKRVRFLPGAPPLDVEFVAAVPAFGCRHFHLRRAAPAPDVEDDGREIGAAPHVRLEDDGTLTVRAHGREYRGQLGVEDAGDRGDAYDFDPVEGPPPVLTDLSWTRRRHPSGIESLRVRRTLRVPAAIDPSRDRRSDGTADLVLETDARVAPGVDRVDLTVTLHNTARDHRLRLAFPTGAPANDYRAATTFDVAARPTALPDAANWLHPAPTTFCHQGWVHAGGLTVVAPGLPEAEVTPSGDILITLVRSVGWLSRLELRSRPMPAGPEMPAPGAQIPGPIRAQLALLAGDPDPAAADDAETGLRGALAGPAPLLEDGQSLLALDGEELLLSACKPAEDGDGIVVRILNPTSQSRRATLTLGIPFTHATAVRLDETPTDHPVGRDGEAVSFDVPPHALRSILLTW